MLCLNCLKSNDDNKLLCNNCNSDKVLLFKKKKYQYLGQTYSKDEWLKTLSTYQKFSKSDIYIKNTLKDISASYLKSIFIKNVDKHTFLRSKLPCYVFFALTVIISLVIVYIQHKGNTLVEGNENNIILFLYLVDFLYLSFAILFLIRNIRKDKVYITNKNNRTIYNRITRSEYIKMLEIFDANIESEISSHE